jgi:hypothetical protein
MPILSQPAFGPRTALIYVTVGALIDVWTLVWYFTRDYELTRSQQFWVVGLGLTGVTLMLLGLLLGRLGRSARQAELPPEEETRAEAAIQQTAAANPGAAANAAVANGAAAPGAPAVPAVPVTAGQPAMPAAPAAPAAPPAPPAPPGTVRPQPRTT